ncbi:MAG: GNAT family N-acetyltransferase [Candidatus Heteroscillospira sp.]|jgi:GNAT superfamily N-acetyltransferase
MSLRQFESGDRTGLIRLWQTVFGDGEDFITEFLDEVVKPGRGAVWDEDGVIAAVAYIIDGITVENQPLPYIYAVSTLPEYRGRGLGRAVSLACAEMSGGAVLHPAENSLFDWYGKMGFAPCSRIYEAKMPCGASALPLTPLSAEEYAKIRRSLLRGHRFADYEPRLLDWWARRWNGRFYGFEGGCLSISGSFVPELLAVSKGAQALAAASGGNTVTVRTPALEGFESFGAKCDFLAGLGALPSAEYFPFVFD